MRIGRVRVAFTINFAACVQPALQFTKEPLTGEGYGVTTHLLLAVKNSESASISFKYAKADSGENAPIQANLCIIQKGREYKINNYETLKLFIDGVPYLLTEVNSLQDPLEIPENYTVCVQPGRTFLFGTIKEIIKRQLSFLISQDHFSKMVAAKRIAFELSSSQTPLGYPICLEFSQEHIAKAL
ncbi:MAG: hypothetical protein ACRCYZ_04635 [Alphaproteobacteria bacterium]